MNRSHKHFQFVLFLAVAAMLSGCIGRSLNYSAPPEESKLEHVTSANFEERVLKAPCPVLVDFYADWCGPCKQMSPILGQIAAERPDIRIVKVNVDDNPELAKKYVGNGIPQLNLFRGGEAVEPIVGLHSKANVLQYIGASGAAGTALMK
jgi:thioredoxin 1